MLTQPSDRDKPVRTSADPARTAWVGPTQEIILAIGVPPRRRYQERVARRIVQWITTEDLNGAAVDGRFAANRDGGISPLSRLATR
ncbi:hypothetical protein RAS2_14300 [Phycisphaerae bacterium RAS2]|nr:hypothetical protein RAS2_14300 [Phycisphaerae bacterium RAS2]